MIDGVYKDELPVVYNPPKPEKKLFTEDDLYKADTFSFGSIIGQITNKGSNAYAMLPNIEKEYGKDSLEYTITTSRLRQCCKAQSSQIDKTKIGKDVKGIPNIWIFKQKHKQDDTPEESDKKDVYNHILLTKRPYFFKYLYNDAKRAYSKFVERHEITCAQKFRMSIAKLKSLPRKTPEQVQFIKNFYGYMPLTYSDSSMNLVCRYIEDINFNVKSRIKSSTQENIYNLYKNKNYEYTPDQYKKVVEAIKKYSKALNLYMSFGSDEQQDFGLNISTEIMNIRKVFNDVCSNPWIIVNCIVDYFYIESPSSKKDIFLMATYGDYVFKNIIENTEEKLSFPMPDINGDIDYLGRKFRRVEVLP